MWQRGTYMFIMELFYNKYMCDANEAWLDCGWIENILYAILNIILICWVKNTKYADKKQTFGFQPVGAFCCDDVLLV